MPGEGSYGRGAKRKRMMERGRGGALPPLAADAAPVGQQRSLAEELALKKLMRR